MSETRITEGIRLSIIKLKAVSLFINKLDRQPEFKDDKFARGQIISLQTALKYLEKLLKQLYQKAAAYALKKDRILDTGKI